MTAWQLLTSTWHWEPTIILGCAALVAGYVGAMGFRPARIMWYYFAGVLVLFLALVSPLDRIGDGYLFSFHMIQHLLLVQVVPPLLLLGIPLELYKRLFRYRGIRGAERILGQPVLAFLIGFAGLWVSHLPVLYDTALHNEYVHIGQHMIFLISATIYWWVILAPPQYRRLSPLPSMLYLFGATVSCVLLGIILTFAKVGIYPTYAHPADPLGILPLIQDEWGLTPAVDQQVGGVIMWVAGGLVYLLAIFGVMARWYKTEAMQDAALFAQEA